MGKSWEYFLLWEINMFNSYVKLPESMSLLWGDYFTDLTEVEESEGEQ